MAGFMYQSSGKEVSVLQWALQCFILPVKSLKVRNFKICGMNIP
jgi:hypothetical protein